MRVSIGSEEGTRISIGSEDELRILLVEPLG